MTEQRPVINFGLKLPLTITRYDGQPIAWKGVTEEVSREAVAFLADFAPKVGRRVEFSMLLHDVREPVTLSAMGTVLMVSRRPTNNESVVYRVTISVVWRRIKRPNSLDVRPRRTQARKVALVAQSDGLPAGESPEMTARDYISRVQ